MRILVLLTISVLMLFTNCGLFNSGVKEKFEPVFKAEINGELFDGTGFEESAKAGMTMQGEYPEPYLNIFAREFDTSSLPYNEYIGFALFYEEGKKIYKTKKDTVKVSEIVDRTTGGAYTENDGDALISRYEAIDNEEGFIIVEIEKLENGEMIVHGTFEMTVLVKSRADQYSRRVEQDTLHITNGEYRLLLEDRRKE